MGSIKRALLRKRGCAYHPLAHRYDRVLHLQYIKLLMLMKRVLLLIPTMAGVGGTERMVHMLSGLLSASGYDVAQASFDSPGTRRHFESSTPLHGIGPVPRLPLPIRPLGYILAAWRLRRLKQRLGTQVIISNLWGADLISVLAGGVDRKLSLCHTNIEGNKANRLMLRFLPLVAAVYRRFDRVIAVSEPLAKELQTLYKLREEKIMHIDNFIDRPEAVSCLPDDGYLRFVWCGRFSPEKNLTGLLHAWAAAVKIRPKLQLVLLGDGPLHKEMQDLAKGLGLVCGKSVVNPMTQVVFAGRVHNSAEFLLGGRAVLLSSLAEGLPMVLLEAFALGTPVLASDCPAGGVRNALQGPGPCKPGRLAAELTPVGCLLPIPDPRIPQTLNCWRDAIVRAADDDALTDRWREGALSRARLYNSDVAMQKWKTVLSSVEAST
jgi:glycosyltransferase involved in cell wall biosynthesis